MTRPQNYKLATQKNVQLHEDGRTMARFKRAGDNVYARTGVVRAFTTRFRAQMLAMTSGSSGQPASVVEGAW